MQFELGMAAMALAARSDDKPGDKVPDELINQAVKSIIMHEVGHTLGLRHNFKGSTMLPNDQLNDTKVTHEKGLIGSVMDYAPVNLRRRERSRAITSLPRLGHMTIGRSSMHTNPPPTRPN